MKKRMRWLIVVTVLMVVGVVAYYFYVNKDGEGNNAGNENIVGDVDKVLNKDLEERYPYTVREVVQFFVRIQKCYYNEEYTEDELVKLAYKATELFDTELIAENPFDEYYEDLKEEIKLYDKTGKYIYKVMLDDNAEVVYSTVDEQPYASINCTYYLKDENGTSKVKETYILRKDENDRWKILGWKEYEGSEWEQ